VVLKGFSAGSIISFTRTSSASVYYGGLCSTAHGRQLSKCCCVFWTIFPNGLSLSVFEYTYLLWWNSFWTLCPVIAIGLFDRIVGAYTALLTCDVGTYRHVDDHVLMALPELYRYGREGKWFGVKLFSVFMFEGVMQVGRKLCI
jgi:magnesium-transporting ATPase (P-type)